MRSTAIGFLAALVASGAVALGQEPAGRQGRGEGDAGRRGRGAGAVILEQAPTDRSIPISKEKLAQYLKDMDARKLSTLRMIEGGKFNVNIRRITDAETALIHPQTIDVWVVIEGSGTLTTGGRIENGKIVGGESHQIKVGDVEFIPANLPHGVSGVNGTIAWLNIRWDVDWDKK
jgi:mannose-6-phosphate isomerase-like protein (cupin superfamily)